MPYEHRESSDFGVRYILITKSGGLKSTNTDITRSGGPYV